MQNMKKEKNYYDILQTSPDADPEVISAAYKIRSKKFHPDKNKAPEATKQMQVINRAYEILSDPEKRAKYDEYLAAQQKAQSTISQVRPENTNRPPQPKPSTENKSEKTSETGNDSNTGQSVKEAEFVLIPAGTFIMGSPVNEPKRGEGEKQHQVTISKSFYMQTTPVTQGQWQRIMGYNYSYFKGDLNLPVEQVSWDSVQEFVHMINKKEKTDKYRLPTEAQWEYAARAGTSTMFYTGNSEEDLARAGWYGKNSENRTHPVGQKTPNAWGLYDMLGNVAEWVQDFFGDYPNGSAVDPEGPLNGFERINRGGSWYYNATQCRCANRRSNSPKHENNKYVGFRLIEMIVT
ncbi:MAG TPA: SUMF1/EgtB/PvdO family nonheme iron enzyme [Smithella sp.]|nr:SUMF1/EgtB/PvdO family nonheme iron enzyme [Smithella sp.]